MLNSSKKWYFVKKNNLCWSQIFRRHVELHDRGTVPFWFPVVVDASIVQECVRFGQARRNRKTWSYFWSWRAATQTCQAVQEGTPRCMFVKKVAQTKGERNNKFFAIAHIPISNPHLPMVRLVTGGNGPCLNQMLSHATKPSRLTRETILLKNNNFAQKQMKTKTLEIHLKQV